MPYGTFDIHLDNVHINTYENEVINIALCQTEDFDQEPFYIPSENLNLGNNSFTYLDLSKEKIDKNYKVDILVTPMAETTVEATICEGDVYSGNNFSGLMVPGVYKQKLVSSNGCDSVVVLNLSVTPVANTMTIDTICYGNSVIWNGVEYDRSGVYFDTLVSKVTGCDSILTFVLNVQDAIKTDKYVNICFGDTYQFGSQTISATGEYSEQFVTADGCDSIVTLHAVVLPDYRQTFNEVICAGEQFTGHGFQALLVGQLCFQKRKFVSHCVHLFFRGYYTTRPLQKQEKPGIGHNFHHFSQRKPGKRFPICPEIQFDSVNYARMGFRASARTFFCASASARSLPRVVK